MRKLHYFCANLVICRIRVLRIVANPILDCCNFTFMTCRKAWRCVSKAWKRRSNENLADFCSFSQIQDQNSLSVKETDFDDCGIDLEESIIT